MAVTGLRFPTTDAAVSGTTWTNPTGGYTDDGTFISVVVNAKNVSFERELGGYGFDSVIPVNSTINSVRIQSEHRADRSTEPLVIANYAMIGATAGAENNDSTEPTNFVTISYANYARPGGGSWTRADLLDGTFKTRLKISTTGGYTTGVNTTIFWDYLAVEVDYTPPDTTPPSPISFVPASSQAGVLTDTNITITFDENIAKGTGNIELRLGSPTGTILETIAATSGQITTSGTTWTLNPNVVLPTNSTIFVVIPSGAITDTASTGVNPWAGTSTYNFTTEGPPVVVSQSPDSGSVGVSVATNINFNFDRNITAGSGTATIRLGSTSGTIHESYSPTNTAIIISGSTLTINPIANLQPAVSYFVTIPSGFVTDTRTNSFAGVSGYNFATENAPASGGSSIANNATGVAVTANVDFTLDREAARGIGTITLAFSNGTTFETYNAASNTTSVLINTPGIGGVRINPAANLVPATTYKLTIPSGAITDISGSPWTGVTDFTFTTANAESFTSISPANNSTGVAIGANVIVTFPRAVTKGTGTLTISFANGQVYESYNIATNTAITTSGNNFIINPVTDFPYLRKMTVSIPATAARDPEGNFYQVPTSAYTFTTQPAPELDFPVGPAVNNVYSFGDRKWIFNGDYWQRPLVSKLGDIMSGNLTVNAALIVVGNTSFTGNTTANNLTVTSNTTANNITVTGVLTAPNVTLSGSIVIWPGSSIPTGWLVCNGAIISRTTYSALFAVIGTTYGAGDGSTTFALPDLRGEFIRGLDGGRGVDTGRTLGSAQAGDIQSHTHTGTTNTAGAHTHGGVPLLQADIDRGGSSSSFSIDNTGTTTSNGDHTHTLTIANTGGTETRPRNVAMHYIIKT